MTKINNHLNIKFTKEFIKCLQLSNKLRLLYNHTSISPIHLVLSIFLTKNLITHLINIPQSNILFLHFNILIINNTLLFKQNLIFKTQIFSFESLQILINLYTKHTVINTINLLIEILNKNNFLIEQYLINLNLLNLNFNILHINLFTKSQLKFLNTFSSNPLTQNINFNNLIFRTSEINTCSEILSRYAINNILLIGEPGIGKLSLIKTLIYNLKIQNYSYQFNNKQFRIVNIVNFIKELNSNPTFLTQLKLIAPNLILIIPDIELLFSTGDVETSISSFEHLKFLLNDHKLQLIGITTPKLYTKIESNITKYIKFFEKLELQEPSNDITIQILHKKSLELEKFYNIKILPSMLEEIFTLSNLYIKDKKIPGKIIDILDNACTKTITSQHNIVTLSQIYNSISSVTNIPIEIIQSNKTTTNIKNIEFLLNKRVFGQTEAIKKIALSIQKANIGLKTNVKPIGSWILCGPSGTGKTELAKSISELLFGSDTEIIRFDMSEFMEKHSISKLVGSPPGYIGYGEGGLLTEAVKKKPYSLILFDEIEKAHVDITNIMLQVLDEGRLTDSSGQHIDFSNTIILFTSNLGCPKDLKSPLLSNMLLLEKTIHNAIRTYFKPEFINRLDSIIIFYPLTLKYLMLIIDKFIFQLQNQLKIKHILLTITLDIKIKYILAKLGYQPLYGARPLKRILTLLIEKPITDILLNIKLNTQTLISFFLTPTFKINYSLKKI